MKPLEKRHKEYVLSAHSMVSTVEFLTLSSKASDYFPSFGVFKSHSPKNSKPDSATKTISSSDQPSLQADEGDELVAYCCKKYLGDIGYTHTKSSFRRQGFGSAVTLAVANQMFQSDQPIFVYVEHENDAAVHFHESIGFKKMLNYSISYLVYDQLE